MTTVTEPRKLSPAQRDLLTRAVTYRGYILGSSTALNIGSLAMPVGLASTIMSTVGITLLAVYIFLKFKSRKENDETEIHEA